MAFLLKAMRGSSSKTPLIPREFLDEKAKYRTLVESTQAVQKAARRYTEQVKRLSDSNKKFSDTIGKLGFFGGSDPGVVVGTAGIKSSVRDVGLSLVRILSIC